MADALLDNLNNLSDILPRKWELLHKYYAEIAKERMHPDDYHLIEHHKALLPMFENEKDDESKIDVGVDVDKKD
jgi:hypothetical protein